MLTQETKRHIDAARQVLVGVVPNPSSQIDQITNALIYKFMDDMDQSAIKAGGEPSFFIGDLERYAWTRLMDSRLGNQERMNLYSEALVKFSAAKQLPQLFRDIFKSAFLPYRSPEVLGLFLKEIDYFDYSHSDDLGDAYEYLLSVMSSQGDAGQFRTPRHIIDFIVDALNPAKNDKVLDPACGTAGFLVSAYKHILEQHDGKNPDGSKNKEKPLTPDQRKALMNNFEGYDVDPGMVRISQVNLYLHHFRNPKIFNYNTLSQDERWTDKFDVILANPPFMSPRGGVSTHNKFSVKSSRSEVLFVDYIMSHLRPKGRAGIIVPEGIIFQSASAHKQLRKNLIEDGLYAVVSLPSGVFQPYAGVKTSILLFNNELAKQSTEILFLKVENDGFDLGATKRPINKNDLPQALEIIGAWKDGKKVENKLALYVEKTKIVESNDYSLSGDRYRIATDYTKAKWSMVELGEFLDYEQPTDYIVESVDYNDSYPTPVLTAGKSFILGYTNEKKGIFHNGLPVIIFDDFTTATKFVDFSFKVKSSAMKILHAKTEKANIRYIFWAMQNIKFTPGEHKRYWISQYSKFKIPLPPIEVQEQIVAELDGYQNIISGARQIVDNWKPKIDIDPKWRRAKLGEVCDFVRGPFGGSLKKEIFVSAGYAVYEQSHAIYENFSDFRYFVDEEKFKEMKRFEVKPNDLIMSCSGTMGKTAIVPIGSIKGIINQALLKLKPHKGLSVQFLKLWMDSDDFQGQLLSKVSGVAIQNVASVKVLQDLNISLASIDIQKQIVEKIEAERALVESSKKLIEIYEQKTKDVLSKLWKE
ncbi:MAG: N-6 DNA methylase [Candidatus Omnitrophota bacterium]